MLMKKGLSRCRTCGECSTERLMSLFGSSFPPSSSSSSLDVAAAVTLARLELYESLVHRLQDGGVHLLHDVLQLIGV